MYKNLGKRFLDFILSACILILFFPILILIGLVLWFQNKGNPFFFQTRPGLNEKAFKIIKFKTMTDEKGTDGVLLPDSSRLTKIGSFVRKTSLDELPQLINVLKGDMSLIGPRPLLFKYLPLYSSEQLRRHNVKPGITGLAQVNGRNSIGWSKKFEFDVFYVDHSSFLLDIKILLLTIKKVIISEGVNQTSERPMSPFNGHN